MLYNYYYMINNKLIIMIFNLYKYNNNNNKNISKNCICIWKIDVNWIKMKCNYNYIEVVSYLVGWACCLYN